MIEVQARKCDSDCPSSLHGTWGPSERREIRRLIRNAYDTASGAVHAGEVEYNGHNLSLLRKTQGLCRRGILKLLEHGPPEDWGDLSLGADIESA